MKLTILLELDLPIAERPDLLPKVIHLTREQSQPLLTFLRENLDLLHRDPDDGLNGAPVHL